MRALATAVCAVAACAVASPPALAAPDPPNIVVVTSDDQPVSSFTRRIMPRTFRLLADQGTNFTDAVTVVPVCCPSRATLVTGQYPHNHRVLSNEAGYGALTERRSVLPVWLKRAGYKTAHFGKWLHGYEDLHGAKPAPGWDRWLTQLAPRRYNDYALSDEGRQVHYGSRPRDHLSLVLNRGAQKFVANNVDGPKPLFVQLDHYAPHRGAGIRRIRGCIGSAFPQVGDFGSSPVPGVPRTPAFNELDISDKPYWDQETPLLDGRQVRSLDRRYRCVAESLRGVDRGIAGLVNRFRAAGELRNTAFIFLSDNGYLFGEHRFKAGKTRPLEPAARVPLLLRLPRDESRGKVSSVPVATIDVVPTILDLANAEPCSGAACRTMDGRSLLPLTRGKTASFAGRSILIELAEPPPPFRVNRSCAYRAVRAGGSIYVEHYKVPDRETGICEDGLVREQYDMRADPFQIENIATSPSATAIASRQFLEAELRKLEDCAGIAGRDPATPGGFCD